MNIDIATLHSPSTINARERKKLKIESAAVGILAELAIRCLFMMAVSNHIILDPMTLDHAALHNKAFILSNSVFPPTCYCTEVR